MKKSEQDILTIGGKLSKDGVFAHEETKKENTDTVLVNHLEIDDPLHTPSVLFDTVNKYMGALEYTTNTISGSVGERSDSKSNAIIYNQVVSPSLFNPYYGVSVAGASENIPLIDTREDGEEITAKTDINNDTNALTNVTAKLSFDEIDDCSIGNLVKLSSMEHSVLGQARYKYSDFMYCRDVGKIPNNRLITLRKFSTAVGDNIFNYADYRDDNSNFEVAGDVGRMVTWFGTDENKIEDILKYSFSASWKELNAEIQQRNSNEDSRDRGPLGGLINMMSPNYNDAVGKGLAANPLSLMLGKSGSSSFFTDAPYKGNTVVNGSTYDKNKVYEPVDTIRSTYVYEGKLSFTHSFKLVFNYKLRGYNNINAKSAFLDLLANILTVTYRQGTFWAGEQRILGAPQNKQGWNKAMDLMNKGLDAGETFISRLLRGENSADTMNELANTLSSISKSGLGIDFSHLLENPIGAVKQVTEKLSASKFFTAFRGNLQNKLGRPEVYAFDSLLSNDAVGLWHVTIGNPLNPIISMGNLILKNCSIEHSGPLGLDDFPTDLKVTVELEHGMPRDSVDIQRMYTKGRQAIYSKISNKNSYKFNSDTSSTNINVVSKTINVMRSEPSISVKTNLSDKNINGSTNIVEFASQMGDANTYRINQTRLMLK